MKALNLIAISSYILALTGCAATGTYMEVDTYPSGAIILDSLSNKKIGEDPMLVYWNPNAIHENGKKGDEQCYKLAPITAVWPSGSKKIVEFEYCGEKYQDLEATIERNLDDPNLDVDMMYGNQFEMKRIQRKQLFLQATY